MEEGRGTACARSDGSYVRIVAVEQQVVPVPRCHHLLDVKIYLGLCPDARMHMQAARVDAGGSILHGEWAVGTGSDRACS